MVWPECADPAILWAAFIVFAARVWTMPKPQPKYPVWSDLFKVICMQWPICDPSDLTDQDLAYLRSERKTRTSTGHEKQKMGHIQRQYELVSASEPTRSFILFTRASLTHPMAYSVGLTLVMADKPLVLCRYNGGSHPHKNKLENDKVPEVEHRHLTWSRYIMAAVPDGWAEPYPHYNSMAGALAKLVQDCNVHGMLIPPPPVAPPQVPLGLV